MASRRSSVPVGHFSLVGLKDVREQLGPRWPEVSERVHALARSVIEKRLLPGDVFEQHDEESYIVLFAQLGPKEAEFKSLAIGREITRRLIGEDFEAASSTRTACANLSVEAAASPNSEAQLSAALKSARGVVSRASDEDQQTSSPAAGPKIRASAAPAATGAPNAFCDLEPPRTPLGAKIDRTGASWLYTPIWDLHHRAVIQFRLTSAEEAGRAQTYGAPTPEMVCEIDSWALRKAVGDLAALSRQGKRFSITCPVHAGSVAHPVFRRRLLEALNIVPPLLRRLLTIEFIAPPPARAGATFDRFIGGLKSLGVGVAARIPLHLGLPPSFNPVFSTVTVHLDSSDEPQVRQIQKLGAFATQARNQGLACGATGLSSTSLVLAATAEGFRYLSGRAVQPEIDCISHAIKFDLDRLYDPLLKSSAARGVVGPTGLEPVTRPL